ncbi:30S ribosomal protein S3, chloroplastic-like [Pyrus x bretschneideri]|uniref:30S ribosomal protein S3, chloroplastic-like n=1 Tax=Pyrus x bretschneideri TaxID=225117 RepID=UPI002030DC84|nr:30S ribosomal protein S3, chloroplastic-like [Pyrus x bretschneideri]
METNQTFPLSMHCGNEVSLKVDAVQDSWLWHKRFRHLNFQGLKLLQKKSMVKRLLEIEATTEACEWFCQNPKLLQNLPLNTYVPCMPYPERLIPKAKDQQLKGSMQNLVKVQINLPLLDAIKKIPSHTQLCKPKTHDCYYKNCKSLRAPNILPEFIAGQLKNRVSFGKAMKRAIELTEHADTKGIQVQITRHIDGKEIARVEWIREGSVPLQTIQAEIDYSLSCWNYLWGIRHPIWIFVDKE